MTEYLTDAQRAAALGMSLEQFQQLVGFDPIQDNPEFLGASCPYCEEDDSEDSIDKAEDVSEISDKLKNVPKSKIN